MLRPQARHLRFFNPTALTTSQVQIPRDRLSPGPPLGRSITEAFVPAAQPLLITFATNAPEAAGKLFPLEKPMLTVGRRAGQDMLLPEADGVRRVTASCAGRRGRGSSRIPAAPTGLTPTTATSGRRPSPCSTAAKSSSASAGSSW